MNYTKEELIILPIILIVMLLSAYLLRKVLLNQKEGVKRIPFLVITILIVVLEIIKQIKSIVEGYSMWTFPLHYCSTFFVWFSLAEFTRGEFRERLKSVAFITSFGLTALFYFYPGGVISDSCSHIFRDFSSFHTFTFHHLAMYYCWLSLFLSEYKPSKKDYKYWVICMLTYYTIAVIAAHVFNTNYFSILHNIIPFMENIRLTFGQVIYTIILGSILIFGGMGVIKLSLLIKSKIEKNK